MPTLVLLLAFMFNPAAAFRSPIDAPWKELEALAYSFHKLLQADSPLGRLASDSSPVASGSELISSGQDVRRRILQVDALATDALSRWKRGFLTSQDTQPSALLSPHDAAHLFHATPFGAHRSLSHRQDGPPSSSMSSLAALSREEQVVAATRAVWAFYASFGHGSDEVTPLTRRPLTYAHLGLTALAALDTFLLMELGGHAVSREVSEARAFALHVLQTDPDVSIPTRVLTEKAAGALLGAFTLSGEARYLERAADLMRRGVPAFQTPTGLASSHVNLWGAELGAPREHLDTQLRGLELRNHTEIAAAAAGVLQARALGRLLRSSAVPAFQEHAQSVLLELRGASGLLPNAIDVQTGASGSMHVGLGKGTIEFYQGLLLQWIQAGGSSASASDTDSNTAPELQAYRAFIRDVRCELLDRSAAVNVSGGPHRPALYFVHGLYGTQRTWRMETKACRLPGLLALGHSHGLDTSVSRLDLDLERIGDGPLGSVCPGKRNADLSPLERELLSMSDLRLAERLMDTCRTLHVDAPTGLAPSAVVFRRLPGLVADDTTATLHGQDGGEACRSRPMGDAEFPEYRVRAADRRTSLGPEYAESLYHLARATGDAKYAAWAFDLFQSLGKHAAVDDAAGLRFAPLRDAYAPCRGLCDRLKPSFLAATLKFIWLTVREEARDGERGALLSSGLLVGSNGHVLPIRGSSLEAELILRARQHARILTKFRSAVLWIRTCIPTHADDRTWGHALDESRSWITHAMWGMRRAWSMVLNLGLHRCDHERLDPSWSPRGLQAYIEGKWRPLLELAYARHQRAGPGEGIRSGAAGLGAAGAGGAAAVHAAAAAAGLGSMSPDPMTVPAGAAAGTGRGVSLGLQTFVQRDPLVDGLL